MKKPLIISLAIVGVVLLVSVYFIGVPMAQVNGYKTATKSSQQTLVASVGKAVDSENQHAYFAQDVTFAEAKSAIKVSKDAASDLESKISTNEKTLTNFTSLPLVASVNSGYKKALDLQSLENQYVKTAKGYLAELKGVNAYLDQTSSLIDLGDQINNISNDVASASSTDELAAAFDKLIAKLDEASKLISSAKAPESMKTIHDADLAALNELTALVKQMKSAIVAQDADTFTSLGKSFNDKLAAYNKQSNDLSAKFVEESKLTKLADSLNTLNKQIDAKMSQL